MDIYIGSADLELISSIALAWVLIGLVWLLVVLRNGTRDIEDFHFISDRLGMVILISVIGWPYSFFCWIFSWSAWLTPVSDLMRGLVSSEEIRVLISVSLVFLFILNIAHIWFFIANPS